MQIRVLFVSSEHGVVANIQRLLDPLSGEWTCYFVPTAADALAILGAQGVDVIVSDLNTEQTDGEPLLNTVMCSYPHIVRFAFTDTTGQSDVVRSGELAHQFLPQYATLPVIQNAIEHAYALREILAGETLKKVISRIRRLPGLPAVYMEISKELHSDDPSVSKIGQLIAKDAGLSAQVLKLVNSAYYGVRQKVTSPTHAASLLGLTALQSVVLVADIFTRFERLSALVPQFSLEAFQEHSLLVSRYATAIARAQRMELSRLNDISMGGLLHDTGKLVLAENFPQEYARALDAAAADGKAVWQAEKEEFGTTHAEVGAYLLGLWGIDGGIVEACAFHHQPQHGRGAGVSETSILHVSDAFAHTAALEELDATPGLFDREYIAAQGLDGYLAGWRTACPPLDGVPPVAQPVPAAVAAPPPPAPVAPAAPSAAPEKANEGGFWAGLWKK